MLQLSQVIPTPLSEGIRQRSSDVWKTDWSADRKDCIFIQAPSGTGKTTLIHMLYGLRRDYTGTILWNGKILHNQDAEWLATLRATTVSIIFQDLRIFPELTAWENILLKQNLAPGSTSIAEAERWLEELGIAHKKGSYGRTLSYGEQQRVAIVRALVQPFDLLLMDEPFSHLDLENTTKAASLIQRVAQSKGAGFILAELDDNTYFNYTKKLLL